MANTKKVLGLLLLCSAVMCQLNNCPGFYGGDLIETGISIFYSGTQQLINSNNLQNREHQFPLRVSFSIPNTGLDIAASIFYFIQPSPPSEITILLSCLECLIP